jgi:hypothetical protein
MSIRGLDATFFGKSGWETRNEFKNATSPSIADRLRALENGDCRAEAYAGANLAGADEKRNLLRLRYPWLVGIKCNKASTRGGEQKFLDRL